MADDDRARPAPYLWSIDEVARTRLDDAERRLAVVEEESRAHDRRLHAIEDDERRRKGRYEDIAGIGKALGWLAAVGSAAVAWLNYYRR